MTAAAATGVASPARARVGPPGGHWRPADRARGGARCGAKTTAWRDALP